MKNCIFFQARSAIRDLDPTNDITFLRIRSKKNEVLLAPGKKTFLAKKKNEFKKKRKKKKYEPILFYR